MASLNDIDLGDVQSERQAKNNQLFQTPVPTLDSDNAILFDLFGVTRNISIEGVIIGTSTEQTTFITNIEAIINGRQNGSTFVSSKPGFPNKNVFIDTFEWSISAANVEELLYSITLIEGGEL